MDSRAQLIDRVNALHDEGEHQKIIALIEQLPPSSMGYELTCLLARAYINYAQPYMNSFSEHINRAVELLHSVETEGLSDPLWYYRIGSALYWLDREESALTYLEQCVAMDPSNSYAPELIEQCKRALDRRRIVRPVDFARLVSYFEEKDYSHEVEDQHVYTNFTHGFFIFSIANDGTDLCMWGAVREEVSMELRSRLLQACNDWNSSTTWPKVYVATLDDGRLRLCAEQFAIIRLGMTDAQLFDNIDRFISAAEAFFKDQIERVPALGGTAE